MDRTADTGSKRFTGQLERLTLMLHYTMALESASHALKPLFEAYKVNLLERHEWVAKLRMEPEVLAAQDDPAINELIERIGKESLSAIAGCIVVTGDNILKAVAHSTFKKDDPNPKTRELTRRELELKRRELEQRELKRRFYGDAVRGRAGSVHFGAALHAGANAFRHYEEWAAGGQPRAETKEILDVLGLPHDDEASSRLLELLTPTASGSPYVPNILTYDRFKLEIELAASQMLDASRVEAGDETSAASWSVTAVDGGFPVAMPNATDEIKP